MTISSLRHTDNSTLRSSTGLRTALLDDLVNIDRDTITAEVFGTLQAGIRGSHAEMRFQNFDIAGTAAGITFIQFLNLKSKTKLVNSGTDTTGSDSIKISRLKTNNLIIKNRGIRRIIIRNLHDTAISNQSTSTKKSTNILILRNTTKHTISTGIMSFILTNNRIFASSSSRNQHVRAFLGRRETRCEIVMVLCRNIGLTALCNVRNKETSINTGNRSIIQRNNQRILQILVTEPLIHNEGVGTERQSRHRQIWDTSRDAEIVSNSSNIPSSTSRACNLGHFISSFRNPCTLGVFTVKLLPVLPDKAIRHEEIIRVKVHIVHHRCEQSLHTNNFRTLYVERIAGKNFF